MGSQSRRGFGSLEIEEWTPSAHCPAASWLSDLPLPQKANSPQDYVKKWNTAIRTISRWYPFLDLPPSEWGYTLLTKDSAVYVSETEFPDELSAWEYAYSLFKKGKKGDGQYAFGLPVVKGPVTIQPPKPGQVKENSSRQPAPYFAYKVASPIWLRIVQLQTGKYILQYSFLSAPYPRELDRYHRYEKKTEQKAIHLNAHQCWKEFQAILGKSSFLKGELT
ncbi:hypothetical protein [Thermoflavimicrobium dichotomicum]|uniref:hypothetical protein n=1 Tax=Thermoflavimicrobium dichotomicum TaxID=46223 RepID=UPI00111393BD|nr:hypothetical protein [Thermoflavimicrobium dichotomicum]